MKDWLKEQFVKAMRVPQVFGSVPKPQDPNDIGKGKTFLVTDDSGNEVQIVADRIVGNIANPKNFEINGTHVISMLEFYCQLEGRRPTEEERADWNEIELLHITTPGDRNEN